MKRKIVSPISLSACALLIVLSAAAIFILNSGEKAQNASVYKDGEIIANLPLADDTVYSVPDADMKIAVENGFVFVKQSACKCKTCISFGKMNKSGQSAVCLPQKIVIKLDGDGLDAVL